MNKCKILVPIGCRSDEGISKPIIKRLEEDPMFDCRWANLIPSNFGETYEKMDNFLKDSNYFGWEKDWKPDLILITADRIEMTAAACAAFHSNVPIAHYGAGITNYPLATLDDVNRHCITLWSDLALCEDFRSAEKAGMLWLNIEKLHPIHCSLVNPHQSYINQLEEQGIHIVGITHLDDLVIDESFVHNEPYDLVLYNPITCGLKENVDDFEELLKFFENENVPIRALIVIQPNPDSNIFPYKTAYTTKTLPRPQFLGLLKNCKRFITNSSAAYYEAPHFLKPEQIIIIGDRNKNRSTPKKLEVGASDKIVKILQKWWVDKNEV